MTGRELTKRLEASGTGASKLDAALAYLAEHPEAAAHELCDAMLTAGSWPAGTLQKARDFLAADAGQEPVRRLPPPTVAPEAMPEEPREQPPGLVPAEDPAARPAIGPKKHGRKPGP